MKQTISHIYNALPKRLLPWFSENARMLPWREDKNPYHVWVSEIMLQQTRVEAVRGYFTRFLQAYPTLSDLAMAEEDAVLKLWEGLGYYSRARNLLKAARTIREKFSGVFPTDYADILSLAGIGEYTAGAIASICFNLPQPAVDGNVLRVISRLTNSAVPIDTQAVKKEITMQLRRIYPRDRCGDFTQSLMELGATVCIPKAPRCTLCPLSDLCLARSAGTAASLPNKSPKRERRIEEKTVFFFTIEDKLALVRRADSGLLAGLWELPNLPGFLSADAAVKYAEAHGLRPLAPTKRMQRTHIFTHIQWEMLCYYIPCRLPSAEYVWAERSDVSENYALPTAFRIFLEGAQERGCADTNV